MDNLLDEFEYNAHYLFGNITRNSWRRETGDMEDDKESGSVIQQKLGDGNQWRFLAAK